ncbi:MAG: acetolactate synthase small subunit [Mariprofundaceae bacterium]|nr:acetolactate synthase small subunit [Mariprofundaceae bacterium]
MKHIITILVENEFGVLTRITGLFSARGYNIESLNVAPTTDESMSRMTIVTYGEENVIVQIRKQLQKLIPVIKVENLTEHAHMEREMIVIKVQANENSRAEVLRMADVFRARVVDVSESSYSLELTGKSNKVSAFLRMLTPHGVIEMTRTGSVGMKRGSEGF